MFLKPWARSAVFKRLLRLTVSIFFLEAVIGINSFNFSLKLQKIA